MTQEKIYVRTSNHKTKPIHLWHPSGRGESFEELSIDEARVLIKDLEKASGLIHGISFVSHDTAINELQDKLEALKNHRVFLVDEITGHDNPFRGGGKITFTHNHGTSLEQWFDDLWKILGVEEE